MKAKDLITRLSGRGAVAAQFAVTDIADCFYNDFATEASGRYWWWIRMILLEPNELIIDDGDDHLYRLSFEYGTDDKFTFGDPQAVQIEYVDIATRSEAAVAACGGIASVRGPQRVAASYTSRGQTRSNAREGDQVRERIEKLRAALKLPASATDEEVLLAAATRLEADPQEEPHEPSTPPGPNDPPTEPDPNQAPPTPAEPAVAPEPQPQPAQARSVNVDAQALAALQADAAAGRQARDAQLATEDTTYVDDAIKIGKIPSKARANMLAEMKRDREGTRAYLDELSENVIPIALRGNSESEGASTPTAHGFHPEHDQYLAMHMPDVARRKARLLAGHHSRVMTDGSKLPAGVSVEA